MSRQPTGEAVQGTVGVIVLVRFKPRAIGHALAWLATGRRSIKDVSGLKFCKILGSGKNAGFGVTPGFDHQGLFCTFRNEACANAFLASSPAMTLYRSHAIELFHTKLRAVSSRGRWSGVEPLAVTASDAPGSMIASLTRASIRPAKAVSFWRHAAPAQSSLLGASGCLVAAGLGEAPFLRQATFTIWTSSAAMAEFARTGAHLDAIRAARREAYFSEDLFARFQPYDLHGSWKGYRADGAEPEAGAEPHA